MPFIPDRLDAPLLLTQANQRAYKTDPESPYGGACVLAYEGPGVAIVPEAGKGSPYPDVTTTPGWLQLREDLSEWYDLTDSPAWDLDGLTSLGIECWLTPDALPGAPRYLILSNGREFCMPDNPVSSALGIWTVGSSVFFSLTTTTGSRFLMAKAFSGTGIPVRIACEWDSQTMLISVNGQVTNTLTNVTGTIVQQPWEWVCLGGQAYDWHSGWQSGGFPGKIKGLRLWDGQGNRFLMPCDSAYGPFVRYSSRWANSGYLLLRSNLYGLVGQAGCEVADVTFTGPVASKSGIMTVGAVACSIKNVKVEGCRYGVHLSNNSYNASVDNLFAAGGPLGRAGLVNITASGVQNIRRPRLDGFRYGMALGTGQVNAYELEIIPTRTGIWASSPTDPGTQFSIFGGTIYSEVGPVEAVAAANTTVFSWHGGAWLTGKTPIRLRGEKGIVSLLAIDNRNPADVPVIDAPGMDVDLSGVHSLVVVPPANGRGWIPLILPNDFWYEDLALCAESSGNILVGGTSQQGSALSLPFNAAQFRLRPYIARLDPTGKPLSLATPNLGLGDQLGTDAEISGLAVDGGKVVFSGWLIDHNAGTFSIVVGRLNADLTPDKTFGGRGYILYGPSGAGIVGTGVRLVVQPTGYVVGFTRLLGDMGRFQMHRFHLDGRLDVSFGSNGTQANNLTNDLDCRSYVLKADLQGRLVMTGHAVLASGEVDALTFRWLADGKPDLSFGGIGQDPCGVLTAFRQSDNGTDVCDVLFPAGGGLIIVGQCGTNSGGLQFALAKYDEVGKFDRGFGTGGVVLWSPPTGKPINAPTCATLLPDDSILVYGQSEGTDTGGFSNGSHILAAHFLADGTPNGHVIDPFGPATQSDVIYGCAGLFVGGHRFASGRAQAFAGKMMQDGADPAFG